MHHVLVIVLGLDSVILWVMSMCGEGSFFEATAAFALFVIASILAEILEEMRKAGRA